MFDFGSTSTPGATNYGPYLSLFGGGMSALSQLRAGSGSAALARANAQIAGEQAESEQETGAEQAELYRQHLAARLGKQQAAIGGSGVTMSGSALRGLETTASLGAADMARIQANAARKAWGYEVQQQGDLARAKLANQQGEMGAFGSLITSGAKAYGMWAGT